MHIQISCLSDIDLGALIKLVEAHEYRGTYKQCSRAETVIAIISRFVGRSYLLCFSCINIIIPNQIFFVYRYRGYITCTVPVSYSTFERCYRFNFL
jgi:hypothetical protein